MVSPIRPPQAIFEGQNRPAQHPSHRLFIPSMIASCQGGVKKEIKNLDQGLNPCHAHAIISADKEGCVMALPAKQIGYTFADCLTWNEDMHVEIINGELFMMATPSSRHQEISGELFRQLANFLEGKPCKVYPAPFGVRLFERDGDRPEDVDTVVEPDGGGTGL